MDAWTIIELCGIFVVAMWLAIALVGGWKTREKRINWEHDNHDGMPPALRGKPFSREWCEYVWNKKDNELS